MTEPTLSFPTRLWFCWVAFFRVLFDGQFAARTFAVARGEPALRLPARSEPPQPAERTEERVSPKKRAALDDAPALELLSLLQREGRFVDFLQQDVLAFSDADIGAAARVVHEGCRRALATHAEIVAVRSEAEGSKLMLEAGFDAAAVKLTGDVHGSPPYRGTLRHRGWRVQKLKLPERIGEHDPMILAPAEVEL